MAEIRRTNIAVIAKGFGLSPMYNNKKRARTRQSAALLCRSALFRKKTLL